MTDSSIRPTIDLAGWWTCRLDEDDRALAEHWWRDEMRWSKALYAHAELPGTTETNQIGRPPDGRTLRGLNRRHPYAISGSSVRPPRSRNTLLSGNPNTDGTSLRSGPAAHSIDGHTQ